MLLKGTILIGFVYQKSAPKPYTIYDNGRKTEGFSYSLVIDLMQQDCGCPTIKCSEEVYNSVNEMERYAFLCTVDTDAPNSSNRFKLVGFASNEVLGRNDWFGIYGVPTEQSIYRNSLMGINPFAGNQTETPQNPQETLQTIPVTPVQTEETGNRKTENKEISKNKKGNEVPTP